MSLSNAILLILMFIPILTFHEAAHAWAAHKLGDDTAKNDGRLTLNPLSHIDPIGTILIPAVSMLFNSFFLLGWGKPVPVDSSYFKHRRRDDVLVSLAGPASNIILALIVLFACRWLSPLNELRNLGSTFAFVSVYLAVFNLLPIPPLDGWYPLKHLFRLPDGLVQRGGMWWFVILIILINLKPVQFALLSASQVIVNLLKLAVQY